MTDRPRFNLDRLLEEVRGCKPEPSEALLTRIIADAHRVQSQALAVAGASHRTGQAGAVGPAGWLDALLGLLGGWPAVGGLVGCLLIGLALGVTQPGGMLGLSTINGSTVRISVGVDENPLNLLGR